MNGINKVLLFGTVGVDPEIKYIGDASRVAVFRMATNESFLDKEGVRKEKTEWHNVEAWGRLCDTIANHVKKGTSLIVEGKLRYESYPDKTYPERTNYKTKIVIDSLNFVGDKKKQEEQYVEPTPQPQYVQPMQQQPMQQQHVQPVQQQQHVQPMQQQQHVQPMQQQQHVQPVQQQQHVQPVQQQQHVQPVQQQPMQQQPMQQQPMQQQPMQQQQVMQAQQEVGNYMSGEEAVTNMQAGVHDEMPF